MLFNGRHAAKKGANVPNTNYRKKKRKKESGPLRYANYNRCSSDDQKYGDFTTIDNQKLKNAGHIRTLGGVPADTYTDEGKTGTNLMRPEWKRLLADAQAGNFDAVVVTYMSRLARGPMFYVAEHLLAEAGIDIIMVEEHFSKDLSGQITKDVTIFADGIQPKQAAMHTRTKMEGMVAHGYVCGRVAFGYRKQFTAAVTALKAAVDKEPPQVMIPDEDAAPLVRQAFAMAKARCTRAEIREYLIMVTGRTWTTTQVTNLLTDRTYLGEYEFGDWKNDNHHAAIIPLDLWDAVQENLAEPPARPPRKQKEESV
ncbi:MAG: recombinase family protein, partial [Fibrella sp.]|nr:recombinase family protein [Armatimonadota bacterium]